MKSLYKLGRCRHFSKWNFKRFQYVLPKAHPCSDNIAKKQIPENSGHSEMQSCTRLHLIYRWYRDEGLEGAGSGEQEGQGARKSAILLTYPPGLGEPPSPGTVRKGTSAISLRAFLFCLEVNYFPFGKFVNIKR